MASDVLAAVNRWADGPGSTGDLIYGVNDCCQFVGTVLRELTGWDYLAQFDYHSPEDADDLVRGRMVEVVSTVIGSTPCPLKELSPGDPVYFDDALGILLDTNTVAGLSPRGRLFRLPHTLAHFGWPCPKLPRR